MASASYHLWIGSIQDEERLDIDQIDASGKCISCSSNRGDFTL